MTRNITPSRQSRSRFPRMIGQFLALSAILLATTTAYAEQPLKAFAGKYKFKGTEAQAKAIIEKAVEKSLEESDLNMIMKMMIKKAISSSKQSFSAVIIIETPPEKIGIKLADGEMITQKIGETKTHSRDGRSGKVTFKFGKGKITTVSKGDEGKTTSTLKLSDDGKTLWVRTTISSPRLKAPFKFAMTYVKK